MVERLVACNRLMQDMQLVCSESLHFSAFIVYSKLYMAKGRIAQIKIV